MAAPVVANSDDFLVRWWSVVAPAMHKDLVLNELHENYSCAGRTDMCKVNKAASALCKSDWHQRACMGELGIDGLTDTSDPIKVKMVLKIIKLVATYFGGVSAELQKMKFHPVHDRYVAIVTSTALRVLKLGPGHGQGDAHDAEFLKIDVDDELLISVIDKTGDETGRKEMPKVHIEWSPYGIYCVVWTKNRVLFVNGGTQLWRTILNKDADYEVAANEWSSDGKYMLTTTKYIWATEWMLTDNDWELYARYVHLYDIAANTSRCLNDRRLNDPRPTVNGFSNDNRYCFWSGTELNHMFDEAHHIYVPMMTAKYVTIYNLNNHTSHTIEYEHVRYEVSNDAFYIAPPVVEFEGDVVVVTRASGEKHEYDITKLEFTKHIVPRQFPLQ
jgi:hypothetical protein